jgi:3-hydroxyacyl-[acyl-carrier-protein] dehydratase
VPGALEGRLLLGGRIYGMASTERDVVYNDETDLNVEAIKAVLPHRYPFLLVDRITALTPGKHAIGRKCVTINEPFFQGHFPIKAIMPGVLVIEAMAQVGGVMMLAIPEAKGKLAYIAGINDARFRKPVVPGDVLECETTLLKVRGDMGKVACLARVGGQVAAEAEILFALVNA